MNRDPNYLRREQPLAWTFHRHTCRWLYNVLSADYEPAPTHPVEDPDRQWYPLPHASLPPTSLRETLTQRMSCRDFTDESVSIAQLAALAWATYGTTEIRTCGATEYLGRTVPSGGGLYPLDLWLIANRIEALASGVYHYQPFLHGLERTRDAPIPEQLQRYLFMQQPYASQAAIIALISYTPERNLWKYSTRGYRYALLEAGHAMQNLNLSAIAVGLATCNLGGFFDDELAGIACIDIDCQIPLYAAAIGVPDGAA